MSNLGASSTSISGSGSGSVISLGSSCSSNWTIRKKNMTEIYNLCRTFFRRLCKKHTTISLYRGFCCFKKFTGKKHDPCRVHQPEHLGTQLCRFPPCESGLCLHAQRVSFLTNMSPSFSPNSLQNSIRYLQPPTSPTSKHLNLTVQNPSGPQMEDLPSMVVPVVGNEAPELPLEAPHPAKRLSCT